MISREQIYVFFDKNFDGLHNSTNGWYTCTCPYCDTKYKLSVHPDYKLVKCWKGCVEKQYIPFFLKDYYHISYFEALQLLEEEDEGLIKIPRELVRASRSEIKLPPGFQPILGSDFSILGNRARKYLEKRNLDLNYLDRLGVGFCAEEAADYVDNYFGYLIIPFHKEGKLSYFIGRDFLGRSDKYRYKNPELSKCGVGKADVLFNESALYLSDLVYITEGWACAATIGEKGMSVQGLDFSSVQLSIILKSPVKEIVIIPDAGAYKQGLKNARQLIPHKKVRVMSIDKFKTIGLGKDVNEIGWDLLKHRYLEYPILTMKRWYAEMLKAR